MSFIPSSLFARFFIIILAPIILLQLISSIVFYERHWDNVRHYMHDTIIREIVLIVNGYENYQGDAQFDKFLHLVSPLTVQVSYQSALPYPLNKSQALHTSDPKLSGFQRQLSAFLHEDFSVYYIADYRKVRVQIFTPKMELLLDFPSKKISSPTTYIFVLWVIGSGTLLVIISLLFMKNQVRSITAIAIAAEKLGKGQNIPYIKLTGAREIKKLALAFRRMQRRIERQITYRTELLAHLSHDLRTPLTRVKLQLAMMETQENQQTIDDMNTDLNEMEVMLTRHLNLAKGDGNEVSEKLDVIALIKEVLQRYRDPRLKLSCHIPTLEMYIKKEALKRALQNIIDNALKYAHAKILVKVKQNAELLLIQVDDDGPGIPADKIHLAFKPFTKLDEKSAGFGLGLAIVRNIVSSHGGEVKLARSSKGGLSVAIKLPF